MLETNTDRSYFMIGAMVIAGLVVIGAVTVFGFVAVDGWAYDEVKNWMASAKSSIDSTISDLGS